MVKDLRFESSRERFGTGIENLVNDATRCLNNEMSEQVTEAFLIAKLAANGAPDNGVTMMLASAVVKLAIERRKDRK